MRYVLIDESTAAGNAHGGAISSTQLQSIASACNIQLNRDVATRWGGAYAVRAGSSKSDVQAGEIVCAIVDTLPDAPGAVAYHDVDGNDVPYVMIARDQCSAITSGSSSVSMAASHEICEASIDAFINVWRDDGKGAEWAQEACDAVQEASYEIQGVTVSDFLFPAFFGPQAAGPYDYLQVLTRPFQTAPGGYQIKRTSGGGESQVFGEIGAHRLAKKRHFSSRTYRRGVRL